MSDARDWVGWLREAAAAKTELGDESAIVASLDGAFERARASWPGVDLEPRAFAHHVGARLPVDEPAARGLAAMKLEDLYLACACAKGSPRALAAFDRALLSQLPAFLSGHRPSEATVDEVRQILREKLFVRGERDEPRIADFTGRASLAGWLRVAASRTLISLQRGKHNEAESLTDEEGGDFDLPVGTDPELDYLRGRHGPDFARALRDAVSGLPERERNVMRFYYVDGLTVDQIGGLFQVNKSTVSRWLTRSQATVLESMRSLLAERLRMRESELQSAFAALESRLDVSLRALFASKR